MVAGWHADHQKNSMTERIKPVELKDRKIFSPERGLAHRSGWM
jgi:hypothetical protein